MNFEPEGIYHIFNQGNNKQKVFYYRENYLFFLRKVRVHVLPFADILAWCLMPNHFHLMVEVRQPVSRGATLSRTPTIESSTQSGVSTGADFNHSIGILLASYTRAINRQNNSTGSLFRQKTKAICLNEIHGVSSPWYTSFVITFMKVSIPEFQYPQVCFNYIHSNPVRAGLSTKAEDWEFSSYIDLVGVRAGSLVNRQRVTELGLICE